MVFKNAEIFKKYFSCREKKNCERKCEILSNIQEYF